MGLLFRILARILLLPPSVVHLSSAESLFLLRPGPMIRIRGQCCSFCVSINLFAYPTSCNELLSHYSHSWVSGKTSKGLTMLRMAPENLHGQACQGVGC